MVRLAIYDNCVSGIVNEGLAPALPYANRGSLAVSSDAFKVVKICRTVMHGQKGVREPGTWDNCWLCLQPELKTQEMQTKLDQAAAELAQQGNVSKSHTDKSAKSSSKKHK